MKIGDDAKALIDYFKPDRIAQGVECPKCGWGGTGIRDEGCFFPEYDCPRTDIRINQQLKEAK
jgi:hypothetical protein